jgi:guanylate kinase
MVKLKKGIAFVLSAPSGCGKTTLIKKLLKEVKHLEVSVSATTRQPRQNEKQGKDYYFISVRGFKETIKKNGFIEWAEVFGDFYGTPKEPLLKKIEKGKDVILSLDTQGAKNLKSAINTCVNIFLFPPSLKELQNRLLKRQMDSSFTIRNRLNRANYEIKAAKQYDYWIVNDNIKDAYIKLKSIIIAERCRNREG